MSDVFPGTGHKYLVDFKQAGGTGRFKVQLDFKSDGSLVYTGVNDDNSLGDSSDPMVITVEPIRDQLFLVTWKETEGTTVVHLEDYKNNTIITNITDPNTTDPTKPTFLKFSGPMTQIA